MQAEMEDDCHHFACTLSFDARRVTGISGEAIRAPWTTCPGALQLLGRLDGIELDAPIAQVSAKADLPTACTHLMDLALLCFSHAGQRTSLDDGASETVEVCQYDVAVTEPVDGPHRAELLRDGRLLFALDLDGDKVVAPEAFVDFPLRHAGFGAWAREHLDDSLLEAATVLRRALQISNSRLRVLDLYETAADLPPRVRCFTQTPEMASLALRNKGSQKDFTNEPEGLFR